MSIPQEKLNELINAPTEGLFDEHAEEEETVEEEVVEQKVEEKVSVSPEEDTAEQKKARIPYSRFEKVNERAVAAETRLAMLEEQLAANSTKNETADVTPEEWIKMYGDNDDAREAWKLNQQLNERIKEEMKAQVLAEIDNRQKEAESEVERNLEYIEDNLAQFQDKLGRDLTEAEESAILDIQDEFTPKDDKGNYIAPLLSAEKAFEVYTLRQAGAKAEKSQARRRVVSVTGSSDSEGDAGLAANSAFENFRPGMTGLWRDKL